MTQVGRCHFLLTSLHLRFQMSLDHKEVVSTVAPLPVIVPEAGITGRFLSLAPQLCVCAGNCKCR